MTPEPAWNPLNALVRRLRTMSLSIVLRCGALIAITGAVACAPRVILSPPVEWPGEWRSHKLYHTPRALIYATSAAAAGEADRLTNDIATRRHLPTPSEANPEKGLIIVSDRNDAPISDDLDELLSMFIYGQAQLAGVANPQEDRVAKVRERMREDDGAMRPILGLFLRMTPLPIADAAVSQKLQLPSDASPAVAWAGVLPTNALIHEKSGELLDVMLDAAATREELPAGARLLISPMMPMIRGALAKEVLKQRDASFENIVRQDDPVWIAERDARRIAIAAWPVVVRADRPQAAYDAAYLRIRESANKLPEETNVLRALAAAEYRTRRYEEAVATLDRVRELDRRRVETSSAGALGDVVRQMAPATSGAVDTAFEKAARSRPSDLAFRAMAAHRLGRGEMANEAFDQLTTRLAALHDDADDEDRTLHREAASLLGRSTQPTTQPASDASSSAH